MRRRAEEQDEVMGGAYLRGGDCPFVWQRNCFHLAHNESHHAFVKAWEGVAVGRNGGVPW